MLIMVNKDSTPCFNCHKLEWTVEIIPIFEKKTKILLFHTILDIIS
jgi:hypothetical protein